MRRVASARQDQLVTRTVDGRRLTVKSEDGSAAMLRIRQLQDMEFRPSACPPDMDASAEDTLLQEANELLDRLQNAISGRIRNSSGENAVSLAAEHTWAAPDALLNAEEEQVLFRSLHVLRKRARQLQSGLTGRKVRRETIEQLEESVQQMERIRSQLVSSNLRLVTSLARRFAASRLEIDELSSDGAMILLSAIDRFDPFRGFRFSTYATHSIQRHFFRGWKIRRKRKERFQAVPGELFEAMAEDPVDAPICDNPEHVVGDLLSRATEVLDDREQQILVHRFGLSGLKRKSETLREVAADLGISKERVRQLQMKALEKLRLLLDPALLSGLSSGMA